MNKERPTGPEFSFKVYSARWGHDDTYYLIWTEEGWYVYFGAKSGQCDHKGKPNLFSIMDNDMVSYPGDLGHYLSWLWIKAKDQSLGPDEIQKRLNDLSDWCNATTAAKPRTEFWDGV